MMRKKQSDNNPRLAFPTHQEDVGEYGVLKGGVHQGFQGRQGTGGDFVHVIQDKVTNIINLGQIDQEQT